MEKKMMCQNQVLLEMRLIVIYGEACSLERVGRVSRFGKFHFQKKSNREFPFGTITLLSFPIIRVLA